MKNKPYVGQVRIITEHYCGLSEIYILNSKTDVGEYTHWKLTTFDGQDHEWSESDILEDVPIENELINILYGVE